MTNNFSSSPPAVCSSNKERPSMRADAVIPCREFPWGSSSMYESTAMRREPCASLASSVGVQWLGENHSAQLHGEDKGERDFLYSWQWTKRRLIRWSLSLYFAFHLGSVYLRCRPFLEHNYRFGLLRVRNESRQSFNVVMYFTFCPC